MNTLKVSQVVNVNKNRYKVTEIIAEGRLLVIIIYLGAYGLVYKVQRQGDMKMFALKKMNI